MTRDLGAFTTANDRRHARSVALTTGAVVFAAVAAAGVGLGRYLLFLAAFAVGIAAFVVHRRFALARAPRGVVDVEDDERLGAVLVLRRDGRALYRAPLRSTAIVGRTRALSVGPVRVQLEVRWEGRSFVASLAVPFKGAPFDVDGVLPTSVDLDRTASRALDALSYELAADDGP